MQHLTPQPSAIEERSASAPRVIAITPKTLWQILALIVGAIGIGVILIHAMHVLLLIFIAIVVAEGLRPLMQWLQRYHVPRLVAVLLIYLVLFGLFGAMIWALARPLIAQIVALSNDLPHYIARLQVTLLQAQRIFANNPAIGRVFASASARVGDLLSQGAFFILGLPVTIVSFCFEGLVVLVIAFFWLTSLDPLQPFLIGLLPSHMHDTANALLEELSHKIGGYIRGISIHMVAIGLVAALGDWVLGLPYALFLGIFAGLTEAIPFLGPFIGGGAAILVAVFVIGWGKALEITLLYLVIQQAESNLLVPFVMNRVVKLHPLTILLAVLFGGALLGIIGALVAVPVAVVIHVVVVRVLAPLARQAAARSELTVLPAEDRRLPADLTDANHSHNSALANERI